MNKKILISLFTVILSISLLTFSAFASTETFDNLIGLSYVNVRGLTVGEDYNRVVESGDGIEQSKAYAIEQGVPKIQYFYCQFYVATLNESSNTGSYVRLGNGDNPFYNGDYVHSRLKFKLYCDFRNGTTPMFDYMALKVRTSSNQGVWNWETQLDTAGSISYSDFKQDSSGNWYTDCDAVISYKNRGETIDNFSLQFLLCVKGKQEFPFYASVYTYTPYVYDFYVGDGTEPDAPVYVNPSEIDGGKLEDYNQKEQEILNATQDGQILFGNAVTDIASFISIFAVPLTAFSRAINWLFEDIPFIESLVRISLSLGLVGFVLNFGSALIRGIANKGKNRRE